MRPIYKSLALTAMTLQVSLTLNAETRDDESASTIALQAELLDSLRVELVAQNVSGARNLIESGECVINGSNLVIALDTGEWTRGAMYRVQVLATFGTQTQVIYALNVTVPYYEELASEPQEYEDTVTVVSTITDVTEADLEGLALEETSQEIKAAITPISAAAEAYNVGKTQLAAAISAKGVPATVQDNLSSMATKVLQIPQELNTGVSDFEQVVSPSPYIWNVYSVANDLMKDTLPDYLPAYMAQYKQQYGANSFFVGEYYLGYASLELTGADGYLTCDGDFYTIAGEVGSRIVTHTSPDGTVETYAAESIIHTWHDSESGRCNRYVVFFYLASAYSFANVTSSICPRRVALCGECTSFVVSGENRLTDVWVIGTLGHFEGGASGDTWNPSQVIRNYSIHSSGNLYTNFGGLSCILPDIIEISGNGVVFYKNAPEYVIVNSLSIGVNACLVSTVSGNNINKLSLVEMLKLTTLDGKLIDIPAYNESGDGVLRLNSLKKISCPLLNTINGYVIYQSNSTGYYREKVALNLEEIYMPSLTTITSAKPFLVGVHPGYGACFSNLIDVTVGSLNTNLYFQAWNPANILADATKKAQLIENIKNHILARVSDATGGTQLVFTVSTGMYNNIASEQIEWQGETMSLADAFLTKNWLLAGA